MHLFYLHITFEVVYLTFPFLLACRKAFLACMLTHVDIEFNTILLVKCVLDYLGPSYLTGTDTTGCIRIPAAFCGLLSYRPSHGAVSMIGVLPNSQSLDTVGRAYLCSATAVDTDRNEQNHI